VITRIDRAVMAFSDRAERFLLDLRVSLPLSLLLLAGLFWRAGAI
jgi:hypothetical protein